MTSADPPDRDSSLDALADSTKQLLATAHALSEARLREPSLLPGWSRAHVLAHVAGNAVGLANLATWARTGVETPQYESSQARERAIHDSAADSRDVILQRLESSADLVAQALAAIPADRQDETVSFLSGATIKAKRIVDARLREVEIHHVDLDAGYDPSDWPADFVHNALRTVVRTFDGRSGMRGLTLEARDSGAVLTIAGGGPPTLAAPEFRLLAWLIGRQDGRYLVVSPAGPPPTIPTWT